MVTSRARGPMPVYDPFSEVVSNKLDDADGGAGASDAREEYKYDGARVGGAEPIAAEAYGARPGSAGAGGDAALGPDDLGELGAPGAADGRVAAASAEETRLADDDDDGATDEQLRSRAMLHGLKKVRRRARSARVPVAVRARGRSVGRGGGVGGVQIPQAPARLVSPRSRVPRGRCTARRSGRSRSSRASSSSTRRRCPAA